MLFNSVEFIFFFILVTSLYFILPHKFRWGLLLAASCYFYMAFVPIYILILGFTIIIDFFAAIYIEKTNGQRRKLLLAASIIANIGILCVFKYYNFFVDNIESFSFIAFGNQLKLPYLSILLPIGLSFHTFQALSYTIEVYRGHQVAERNLGIYSLYVMFYPQLVAGPIERPQNILHQFHERKHFNYDNVTSGLRLMLWGMIKKVVIADRLSLFTDDVFNNIGNFPALTLVLAVFFFSFQIFCDFSGYSDIAIGAARVMGFKLMTNFNQPYQARNISEFWKRWHISLSTWFRDYLYIPLGGNRVKLYRGYLNLFIVFIISGFWHGANWTFIVWGALHGFYLIFAQVTKMPRNRIRNVLERFKLNFLNDLLDKIFVFILVAFAWIYFRANNLTDANTIVARIPDALKDIGQLLSDREVSFLKLPGDLPRTIIGISLIIFLAFAHFVERRFRFSDVVASYPSYLRWLLYFIGVAAIVFIGVFQKRTFIYFQF
ncbi:MAG TPA: MBOAT family O-acyltransferase [Pedobacter sp.]|nr:MBOAT family O-acyltransferase [Pedobacter sp.]